MKRIFASVNIWKIYEHNMHIDDESWSSVFIEGLYKLINTLLSIQNETEVKNEMLLYGFRIKKKKN